MMSPIPRARGALLGIAALCLSGVGAALISQHVFDMPPCAWCVMQRLIYLVIAAVALIAAALPTPIGRRVRLVGLVACLLLSVAGVVAAWYQFSVAAQLFSCDRTFADRFMTGTGLEAAAPFVFGIYATCMDAAVTVLGVEYAIWSLALFAVIALIAAISTIKSFSKGAAHYDRA